MGNGGVGKTSMIKRFCKGTFMDEHKKTIGVDFLEKQLYVPSLGQDVHLYLWDTAGQEEFDSITKTYYRGQFTCGIQHTEQQLHRSRSPAAGRAVSSWCTCNRSAVASAVIYGIVKHQSGMI